MNGIYWKYDPQISVTWAKTKHAPAYMFTSVTNGANMKKIRERQKFHPLCFIGWKKRLSQIFPKFTVWVKELKIYTAGQVWFSSHTPKVRSGRWLVQGKMSIIRVNKATPVCFLGGKCVTSLISNLSLSYPEIRSSDPDDATAIHRHESGEWHYLCSLGRRGILTLPCQSQWH